MHACMHTPSFQQTLERALRGVHMLACMCVVHILLLSRGSHAPLQPEALGTDRMHVFAPLQPEALGTDILGTLTSDF